jgi:uncharacterized membrane protein YfcA
MFKQIVACKKMKIAVSSILALSVCTAWVVALEHNGWQERWKVVEQATTFTSSRLLKPSILDEAEEIPDLFPLEFLDFVGFACTIAGLVLAAGAGIGGGGLLVPIFILIFDFSIKHAFPLASATVLGGAIANNLLNCRKSHPEHPSRPAIDWDLIIQLEPMTMAGALVGAELNDLLPDLVLMVMLFLLLSLTAYKTLTKAVKLHRQETEAFQQAHHQSEATYLLANTKRYGEAARASPTNDSSYGSADENSNAEDKLVHFKDHQPSFGDDQIHQAWISAIQLTVLFVVITALNLLKGGPSEEGGGGPAGLSYCGKTCFWITEAVMLLSILLFAISIRRTVLRRVNLDGPILSDIDWNEENTIHYPMLAIVAGLVAGLFGVGGGIIKGPLMLEMGE